MSTDLSAMLVAAYSPEGSRVTLMMELSSVVGALMTVCFLPVITPYILGRGRRREGCGKMKPRLTYLTNLSCPAVRKNFSCVSMLMSYIEDLLAM